MALSPNNHNYCIIKNKSQFLPYQDITILYNLTTTIKLSKLDRRGHCCKSSIRKIRNKMN